MRSRTSATRTGLDDSIASDYHYPKFERGSSATPVHDAKAVAQLGRSTRSHVDPNYLEPSYTRPKNLQPLALSWGAAFQRDDESEAVERAKPEDDQLLPRINWDGTIYRSDRGIIPSESPDAMVLDGNHFTHIHIGRRGSDASIASSAYTCSSSASAAPSETTSGSHTYRKRQRDNDEPEFLYSPPALRQRCMHEEEFRSAKYQPGSILAGSDMPRDIEILKNKFLTLPTYFRHSSASNWTYPPLSSVEPNNVKIRPRTTGSMFYSNPLPAPTMEIAPHPRESIFPAGHILQNPIMESPRPVISASQHVDVQSSSHQTTATKHRMTKSMSSAHSLVPPRVTCEPKPDFLSGYTPITSGSLVDRPPPVVSSWCADDCSHTPAAQSPLSISPSLPSSTMAPRPLPLPILEPSGHCDPHGIVLKKTERISQEGLPSRHEFAGAMDTYLAALSSKKLPKALITQTLYDEIACTLKREKENLPGIGTPQFRFWCRKHFALATIPRLRPKKQPENPYSVIALPTGSQEVNVSEEVEVVTHDNQPVVTKEKIYDILAQCHLLANHAGRDKTTAVVRKNYSWVPKVLIGDFIKLCPVCYSKKVAGVVWTQSQNPDSRDNTPTRNPHLHFVTTPRDSKPQPRRAHLSCAPRFERSEGDARLMRLAETAAREPHAQS